MKKLFTLFIINLFVISSNAQIIITVAGNHAAGYTGNGGPALSAELNNPAGVATDTLGNVYITDEINNVVRKVNTSGIISLFAGNNTQGNSGDGGLAISAQLNAPHGIAVDKNGNVYISMENVVRKVNTSGIISTVAGNV